MNTIPRSEIDYRNKWLMLRVEEDPKFFRRKLSPAPSPKISPQLEELNRQWREQGERTNRKILAAITRQDMSTSEVIEAVGMNAGSVKNSLYRLRSAGRLTGVKRKYRYYWSLPEGDAD